MASCPVIVRNIITAVTDLRGSTESTTHGTKVTISCGDGYHVDGEDNLTCNNGKWEPGVPTCKVGSPTTGGSKWSLDNLTETDTIVLAVCVSVAVLVLLILLILCILYQRKKRRLGKDGDTKKIIKHQETNINYIGSSPYDDGYSQYSEESDYHGHGGYVQDPYRKQREDPYRREPEDPYRREREDPYRRDQNYRKSYRDDYYKNPRRAQSLDRFQHDRIRDPYAGSSFQGYRTGPVRLDTKRANWHDRYDYSRSQLPRVHSAGHMPSYTYGDYYGYR